MEWCLSGLKSSVANRVYGNTVPRVQIPLTPTSLMCNDFSLFELVLPAELALDCSARLMTRSKTVVQGLARRDLLQIYALQNASKLDPKGLICWRGARGGFVQA